MGIVPNKEVTAKGNNSSIEEDAYPVPNANKVTKKPIKTDGAIAIPPQIRIQIFIVSFILFFIDPISRPNTVPIRTPIPV
tara:strand:- start:1374 stop:1613 length:240 start_codon:yes stop_codon:yes gene_type:complete